MLAVWGVARGGWSCRSGTGREWEQGGVGDRLWWRRVGGGGEREDEGGFQSVLELKVKS